MEQEQVQKIADVVVTVVRLLVDRPHAVSSKQLDRPNGLGLLIGVHPSDYGLIIGRHGQTVSALRTIVTRIGITAKMHVEIDIFKSETTDIGPESLPFPLRA